MNVGGFVAVNQSLFDFYTSIPWQFVVAGAMAIFMAGMFYYVSQMKEQTDREKIILANEMIHRQRERMVTMTTTTSQPHTSNTCADCLLGETEGCSYWRTQGIYLPHANVCNEFIPPTNGRWFTETGVVDLTEFYKVDQPLPEPKARTIVRLK